MIEINSTYRLQTEGNCIFSGSGVRLIEFHYAPPRIDWCNLENFFNLCFNGTCNSPLNCRAPSSLINLLLLNEEIHQSCHRYLPLVSDSFYLVPIIGSAVKSGRWRPYYFCLASLIDFLPRTNWYYKLQVRMFDLSDACNYRSRFRYCYKPLAEEKTPP